jgi:hypothetical protein
MKLIKLIERPRKSFGKPGLDNEFHILEPSAEDLEKALAYVNINGLDTLVIYKD